MILVVSIYHAKTFKPMQIHRSVIIMDKNGIDLNSLHRFFYLDILTKYQEWSKAQITLGVETKDGGKWRGPMG